MPGIAPALGQDIVVGLAEFQEVLVGLSPAYQGLSGWHCHPSARLTAALSLVPSPDVRRVPSIPLPVTDEGAKEHWGHYRPPGNTSQLWSPGEH